MWLDEIASGAKLTGLDQDGAADVSAVRWIGGRLDAVVLRTRFAF